MAESRVPDERYFVVHGWMLNRLGLKGVALQVYAIINGFSQDGESEFKGSLQYLMDFTNSSRPTVIKALQDLTEKGLILKTENRVNGVKMNTYKVSLPVVKKLNQGSKETLPPQLKNFTEGSKETLPNNIDINSIDTILRKYSLGRFTETLKKALADWLKYKSERKDKYTETELENLVAQIEKAAAQYGDTAMADVISRSIASGYKGIVFDWLKKSGTKNNGAASGGRREEMPDWMLKYTRPRKTAGEDPAIKARADQLQRDLRGGS